MKTALTAFILSGSVLARAAGLAPVVEIEEDVYTYFTATVRAGSPPSRTLEMLGPRAAAGNTIRYARVRLVPRS